MTPVKHSPEVSAILQEQIQLLVHRKSYKQLERETGLKPKYLAVYISRAVRALRVDISISCKDADEL